MDEKPAIRAVTRVPPLVVLPINRRYPDLSSSYEAAKCHAEAICAAWRSAGYDDVVATVVYQKQRVRNPSQYASGHWIVQTNLVNGLPPSARG